MLSERNDACFVHVRKNEKFASAVVGAISLSLVAGPRRHRNQHAAPRSNADACRRVTSAYNQITKACGLSQAVAEEELVSEAKDDANY